MPDGEEMEDGDAALAKEMGMRHWDAEETGMGADGDG